MYKKIISLVAALIFAIGLTAGASAQDQKVCRSGANSAALDFWLGDWRVTSKADSTPAGHNRIEATLDGCAIFEHWSGAGGSEGKSLFYFDARADSWTQVWVTTDTARPGGLKIKHLVAAYDGPGIRFQGQIDLPSGASYLDRTTLSSNPDGTVRQHIETSRDSGHSWQTTFDAIYTRDSR